MSERHHPWTWSENVSKKIAALYSDREHDLVWTAEALGHSISKFVERSDRINGGRTRQAKCRCGATLRVVGDEGYAGSAIVQVCTG